MRPTFLIGCLWTLLSCAIATARLPAQSPEQRPSNLRDAGVITRAAPTAMGAKASQQPSAQMQLPNFPAMPASESSAASTSSSALSDRAWTNGSVQPPPAARPSEASTPSRVVPAHYTNNDGNASPVLASQTRLASQTSIDGGAPAHEPRPLKPPTASESKVDGQGSTGTVQMFISVLSSLAIVIGLILAAAWFYRKAAPTINGALPKQVVQVLGRTALAPRQQLVLLRLGSKLVLVSNLHGEVRTISEITDPLEVDRLAGLCESAQPGSISDSFRSVLHNMGRNG